MVDYYYIWATSYTEKPYSEKPHPCVIVMIKPGNPWTVGLVPITHAAQSGEDQILITPRYRAAMGLDTKDSWVVLNEVNTAMWPSEQHASPHPRDCLRGKVPDHLLKEILEKVGAANQQRRLMVVDLPEPGE